MMTSRQIEIYEVIFKDEDRETVLKDLTTLNYGEHPFPPENPIKQNDEDWEYVFEGWIDQNGNWLKSDTAIYENLIYIAQYKKNKHNYSLVSMKDADCINDGVEHYICSNCLQEMDIKLPALGHLCKATNVARNKSAMRRGATMVCTRKGCGYWYTLQFQNKASDPKVWEEPPVITGNKDVDTFINGVFHFGADETEATAKFDIEKRNLSLT